ncbi:hypothetical protein Tco_0702555 [Tanacetum coccineum]|uniref:Uncharacterized protein n=1 Tax=Tanacetum coccineum TaxID=301880 RepID=A0ABQ4XWC2_9ASTR
MLEKGMCNSWKSRMELYMMNRQHGRMILESVENGPLIWSTIEENGVIRPKKYSELSATKAIQADCDIKATNIILQGLPPEVYALVSNHKVAKELWERIQLLMQGTSLTKQEREFHHMLFLHIPQSLNWNMPPKLSTNNKKPEFSQSDLGITVPVFQRGDDPIDAINHVMSFLSAVITSRYPHTKKSEGNSSNPRQQATINDGKITSLSYIKHSQEEAAVLRDLVDHIKANYPLYPLLEFACRFKLSSGYWTPAAPSIDGDRFKVTNFVSKILGTVKFGNDL